MTAASSRTPRTPTYRDPFLPPRFAFSADYVGRHRVTSHTPADRTVPAIVERVR